MRQPEPLAARHSGGDSSPGILTVSGSYSHDQQGTHLTPGRTAGPIGAATNHGPHFATTAHGPDLFASSQQAIRYMIDHLVQERGLSREEAYVVSSVAVDLKISEIVDAPNWIVSAFLPESIFL